MVTESNHLKFSCPANLGLDQGPAINTPIKDKEVTV